MAKAIDHRAHALRMAAALGVTVDVERADGELLAVSVAHGDRDERIATNATEPRNAWRWAAEHLARMEGNDAFAATRRAYQDAARAEFEARGIFADAGKA